MTKLNMPKKVLKFNQIEVDLWLASTTRRSPSVDSFLVFKTKSGAHCAVWEEHWPDDDPFPDKLFAWSLTPSWESETLEQAISRCRRIWVRYYNQRAC